MELVLHSSSCRYNCVIGAALGLDPKIRLYVHSCLLVPETALPECAVPIGIRSDRYSESGRRVSAPEAAWTYSGFGIETQKQRRSPQCQRAARTSEEQSSIRGLNRNCNHDLKIFLRRGDRGLEPNRSVSRVHTALLTKQSAGNGASDLARKIATIALIGGKRSVLRRSTSEPQTA